MPTKAHVRSALFVLRRRGNVGYGPGARARHLARRDGRRAAAAATAAPAADGIQYKVLVFTRAVAEQHASTCAGVTAVKALGKEHRFSVHATEDPTEFRADRLKQFRV